MIKGIGIDIVEHTRISNKLINILLTQKEKEYFKTIKEDNYKKEYLASRWALKEAIIKAVPEITTFFEIETWNDNTNKIVTNVKNTKISIAHEKNYSVAIAINSII